MTGDFFSLTVPAWQLAAVTAGEESPAVFFGGGGGPAAAHIGENRHGAQPLIKKLLLMAHLGQSTYYKEVFIYGPVTLCTSPI